jgi:hypothetical protein
MLALAEVTREELTPARIDLYLQSFERNRVPYEALATYFEASQDSALWFPKIPQILEACGSKVNPERDQEAAATAAWVHTSSECARCWHPDLGWHQDHTIDTRSQHAMRCVGGVKAVWDAYYDENKQPFVRRDFIELWKNSEHIAYYLERDHELLQSWLHDVDGQLPD